MEEQLKIEKGIEIPLAKPVSSLRRCKYPWREMEVGDSFLWPVEYCRSEMSLANNAARNFCKSSLDCSEWKFSTRKVEGNRIRIWRIK